MEGAVVVSQEYMYLQGESYEYRNQGEKNMGRGKKKNEGDRKKKKATAASEHQKMMWCMVIFVGFLLLLTDINTVLRM